MTTGRARQLRRDATDAEKRLWKILRDRQLGGAKFRRQQPIGAYFADFVCFEHSLIIEADGGQHTPEVDAVRTRYLEAHGFRVLRFWNNEILVNTEGVMVAIMVALGMYEGEG
jgi:very-short-patch-repair endonuclease